MTFFAFDNFVMRSRAMPSTPAGDVVAQVHDPALAEELAKALCALYMLGYFNGLDTMAEARRIIEQTGRYKLERARFGSEMSGWPPPGRSEIVK